MNFHPAITNWLPYYWMKFVPVPRVVYVLEQLGTEAVLWDGLQPNIRREIRKAEKRVEVVRSDDVDLLVELNRKTFTRQELDLPYTPQTLRRVDAACAARKARQIYFARDEHKRIHAAMYTVFDDRCTYYLLGGAIPRCATAVPAACSSGMPCSTPRRPRPVSISRDRSTRASSASCEPSAGSKRPT